MRNLKRPGLLGEVASMEASFKNELLTFEGRGIWFFIEHGTWIRTLLDVILIYESL